MTESEKSLIDHAISILDSHLKTATIAFTSSDTVKKYVRLHLQCKEREFFGVLFLTNQHRLIEFEIIHTGTVNSIEVHPREVVKAAMRFNAAAVILVHNHPAGCTEPSRADIAITGRLKNALSIVEVRTLEHLIVAGSDVISMAELGMV